MTRRAGRSLLASLGALAVVTTAAVPALAGLFTAFTVDGEGTYYFNQATLEDVYDLQGWFDFCDDTEASACSGSFTAKGKTRVLGLYTGPGTVEFAWDDDTSSTVIGTFAGLPDSLVISGTVTNGTYAGEKVKLVVTCTLESQLDCWNINGATYFITGLGTVGAL